MTDEQKYMFDLQGYIVLKTVVPDEVIAKCNLALDRFEKMDPEDYPGPLCLRSNPSIGSDVAIAGCTL